MLVADFYYYAILKSYQQIHKGSSPRFPTQLLVYSTISFIVSDFYIDGCQGCQHKREIVILSEAVGFLCLCDH